MILSIVARLGMWWVPLLYGNTGVDHAGGQVVRGAVIDHVTEVPLPGAAVVLYAHDSMVAATITDSLGRFAFEEVRPGRYDLQVRFIGYRPYRVGNFLVGAGKEAVLIVRLEEEAFEVAEVTVTATADKRRPLNELATVSARIFSVEETERYAGSLGDPARMAANFAGVSMINDGRNDIIIRGNSPLGLKWRIDGVEVPNPNHFAATGTTGGPVTILNNNLLSNSDFFTAAWPAEYGDAFSGVFDLRMRPGNAARREYTVQMGFNGVELGAEGPLSRRTGASYVAAYRYSMLELLQKLGFDFGTGTALPRYQDLTVKLHVPVRRTGTFSLFGIGGKSAIELYDSRNTDTGDVGFFLKGTDLTYGSHMGVVGASYRHLLDPRTTLRLTASAQTHANSTRIDSLAFDTLGRIVPGVKTHFYGARFAEAHYSLSGEVRRKINRRHYLTAGLLAFRVAVDYEDSVRVGAPGRPYQWIRAIDTTMGHWRSFVHWQGHLSPRLTLTAGAHFHYVPLTQQFVPAPRWGARWRLGEGRTLNVGYGMHAQTPPRFFFFIQRTTPDGGVRLPNRHLRMLEAHHGVIGYDHLWGTSWRLKAEAYYQWLRKVPVSPLAPQFSMLNYGAAFGEQVPDSLVSTGTGRNYGVELTIERFFTQGFYLLATASVFDARYTGYDGVERPTAFANNYVFNLLGGVERSVGGRGTLTVDLRGTYAGGKRYVPIDLEASRRTGETVYRWEEAYAHRYDDYFKIDLRIGFKLNGKRRFDQEWALDLTNLTNHRNIYAQSYNPRTQTIVTDYQTGFVPIMLYRVRF